MGKEGSVGTQGVISWGYPLQISELDFGWNKTNSVALPTLMILLQAWQQLCIYSESTSSQIHVIKKKRKKKIHHFFFF